MFSPLTKNRCKAFSEQPTFPKRISLIMLSGPPRYTNVLPLASIGHPLYGLKITKPSLKSSIHQCSLPLLFICSITICHGPSTRVGTQEGYLLGNRSKHLDILQNHISCQSYLSSNLSSTNLYFFQCIFLYP